MAFTLRELLTIVHGMILGGLLLLGFPAAVYGFWNFQRNGLGEEIVHRQFRRLYILLIALTVIAWLTVILGTYFSYIWYRAEAPAGADLSLYPMAYLLSTPGYGFWEDYCMEWKEHLSWFIPILLTAVTYIFGCYREKIFDDHGIRKALFAFLVIAFAASAIAGLFGAIVTKIAPVR